VRDKSLIRRQVLARLPKTTALVAVIVVAGIIGAAIYVLGGGLKKEAPRAEMPIYQIGDEWVYRVTGVVEYTCRYRVIGEEILKKENSYVVELSYEPPYLGFSRKVSTWEVRETGDILRILTSGKYREEPRTWVWDYTYQYIEAGKWSLEVGKEYTRIQTRIGVENITSVVKVEKWEDVLVPAGKFPCFKLVYYHENGDIWRTEWYSDSVKRNVKWEEVETGEMWELTSYSIGEGSLAIWGSSELEVGDEAMFTVSSRGSPVEGGTVEANGDIKESGADGAVAFAFDRSGEFTVTATKDGYEEASIPIRVMAPSEGAPHYEMVALVNSVTDGDTIDVGILKLAAELDPRGEVSTGSVESIRFGGGIDAPEWYETGGSEATQFIEDLIPPGTVVYLDLDDLARGGQTGRPYRDVYERLVAVIYTKIGEQWVNVNAELSRWGMREFPGNYWDEYFYIKSEFSMYEWPPYDNDYPYVRGT